MPPIDAGFRTQGRDYPVMKRTARIAWKLSLLSLAVPLVATPARAQTDITFYGVDALKNNSTGDYNTAVGVNAMRMNTSGSGNTATGRGALYKNSSGANNTAFGFGALYWNTVGYDNVAVGHDALGSNSDGVMNVAVGTEALLSNVSGDGNTAFGSGVLAANTTGSDNVAQGNESLGINTTGELNTAMGASSLWNNSTGSYNVATGGIALHTSNGDANVAVGYGSGGGLWTGNVNTFVGTEAGVTSCGACTNTSAFGYGAKVTASNTIRIGGGGITQIGGIVGWSNLSDSRYKTNVKANVPGLEFIAKLKPVTFNWKLSKLNEGDGVEPLATDPVLGEAREAKAKKTYTGFIAQDVEAAATECGFDFSGIVKPANETSSYHLTYSEFVVPLVKAVQEQQQEIEELRETVRALAANRQPDSRLGKGADRSDATHAGMLGNFGGAMTLLSAALVLLHLKRQRISPST